MACLTRQAHTINLRLVFAALLVLCSPHGLRAAEESSAPGFTLPGTQVHRLASVQSNVEYELRVWLPEGYETADRRYPLTVLLDADYQFPLAVSILEHLAQRNQADESIIVAIAYPDSARNPDAYRRNRTRDYTPTAVATGGYGPAYQQYSGGAPAFLEFVSDEMMPFMAEHYRIEPTRRTLVGHSFGGLFGAYVLASKPELFSTYILVSPSLWYDQRMAINNVSDGSAAAIPQPTRLYLAVGEFENQTGQPMVDELKLYAAAQRARQDAELEVTVRVFENETHASIYPIALSAALRHLRTR